MDFSDPSMIFYDMFGNANGGGCWLLALGRDQFADLQENLRSIFDIQTDHKQQLLSYLYESICDDQ